MGQIRLDEMFCRSASYRQEILPPPKRLETDSLNIKISVKTWEREEGRVDVELGVQIDPDLEHGQPYYVDVYLFARFHFHDLPEGLTRDEFTQRNAAAIMFPYAREVVWSLTMRGKYGCLWLPTVNVIGLLDQARERDAVEAG